jgi:hypothetical protein
VGAFGGVPDLLTLAETLARRMRGNRRIVRPEPIDPSKRWLATVVGHWATAKVRPPADPAKRVEVARILHSTYAPALEAVRWPRWLLLERAFLDSLATGDLLFAASVLRTMCEAVQRLRALDLSEDHAAVLAASAAVPDQERLKLFFWRAGEKPARQAFGHLNSPSKAASTTQARAHRRVRSNSNHTWNSMPPLMPFWASWASMLARH